MNKLLLSFFSLLLLTSCTAKAQTNGAIAEQFLKAMATGQFEAALKYFAPEVAPYLSPDKLKDGWGQITTAFGPYISHQAPDANNNADMITVGIKFEKGNKGFNCNFNDKHQLVGFTLAEEAPSGDEQSAQLPVSPYADEEVSVPVTGGTLKGSFMKPATYSDATPVALIIAGSGATDRNGNGGKLHTNAYRMLAETLAQNGIASLRYDKRMIGASNDFEMNEFKIRFEDNVTDALQLITYLKTQKNAGKIYIIGHSEGALVGLLAAEKIQPAAYVSVCGAGENIAETLRRQIPNEQAGRILDELKKGNGTNEVPGELQVAFRPSVQPYLISWMKYEPTSELKKLKVPVLIIGGTTDIQVPVADAEALKKAAPGAQLLIVEGMNHILKQAPKDPTANMVTYGQPDLPLHPDFAAGIANFLKGK
jgi:pimeloyl-ACP methyl ester carboxylesterase